MPARGGIVPAPGGIVMEKRAILAAVLMAALLIIYQMLFVRPPEPQSPASTPRKEPAPQGSTAPAPPAPAAPPVAVPPKEAPAIPGRKAVVEAPLYRSVVDSRGGRYEAWDLHYRGEKPMVVDDELAPRGLAVSRNGTPPEVIPFAVVPEKLTLGQGVDHGELRLSGQDGFGLRISETRQFRGDTYVVVSEIKVENGNTVPQGGELVLTWKSPVEWPKERPQQFNGQHPVRTVRFEGGAARREDVAKVGSYQGRGDWVGLESEWYLIALVPVSGNFQVVEAKRAEYSAKVSKV